MGEKLKFAVVGLGEWGPKLARNISSVEGVQLKAVVDIKDNVLSKFKELYPETITINNFDEIFKLGLDAVIISTPAFLHYEQIKKALKKGLHVFAEKPLTLSYREAKECFQIADKKKLTLMAGHTFIYNPAVIWIKNALKNNELGKLYFVSSQRMSLGRIREDVNVLWNLAPHDFSILLYLFNEMPEYVSAQGAKLLKAAQEDVVVVTFEFSDQRLAIIELSWLNPQKVRKMTFVAEKCMVVYDDVSSDERVTVYDKKVDVKRDTYDAEGSFHKFKMQITSGDKSVPVLETKEPLKAELEHFADSIKSIKEPITGKEHALRVIYLLEQTQKSLDKGGKKIKIDYKD